MNQIHDSNYPVGPTGSTVRVYATPIGADDGSMDWRARQIMVRAAVLFQEKASSNDPRLHALDDILWIVAKRDRPDPEILDVLHRLCAALEEHS